MLQDGMTALDYVLSWPKADQPWALAGVLSCIGKGYSLNRLTINWETRDLRYGKGDDGNIWETDRATEGYDTHQRHQCLGVRAVTPAGCPTMGSRWDTLVYEEGLPSRSADDWMGNQRPSAKVLCQKAMRNQQGIYEYMVSMVSIIWCGKSHFKKESFCIEQKNSS